MPNHFRKHCQENCRDLSKKFPGANTDSKAHTCTQKRVLYTIYITAHYTNLRSQPYFLIQVPVLSIHYHLDCISFASTCIQGPSFCLAKGYQTKNGSKSPTNPSSFNCWLPHTWPLIQQHFTIITTPFGNPVGQHGK